ncbi:hypothetical protein BH11VER1_BH11VER1_29210 [soil metagenome]
MHRIPKTVQKIAERLAVCPVKFTNDVVSKQVSLLDQGTAEVLGLVSGLRKKAQLDASQDMQDRLPQIEGDEDKILMDMLRQLYNGKGEAIEVIILKDLYELLEKAIDWSQGLLDDQAVARLGSFINFSVSFE